MTIKKLSSKLTMIMYAVLALFICLGSFAIITNTNAINSQAAVSTVNVTFSSYPDTVKPYCIVKFYKADGTGLTSVLTANGSFNLNSGIGKLEITVPMYCTVAGLPSDAIQNGSTYYIDVDSTTTINPITITYDDQGYFGGTVII